MKFQIGPDDKHAYIYTDADMVVNSAPVYKCRRGTRERSENVLWLAREKDGRWISREAHTDSTDPVRQGRKIFQTQNPIDDITNLGDIDWMWFDTREAHSGPSTYRMAASQASTRTRTRAKPSSTCPTYSGPRFVGARVSGLPPTRVCHVNSLPCQSS